MECSGTIILTTYNNADTIVTCLNYIAQQSCIDTFDLIVHDDCSTDETVSLIRNHFICNLVSALTIIEKDVNYYQKKEDFLFIQDCLKLSRSRWIFFAEADDFWLDDRKLEKQLNYLIDGKKSFSCHTIDTVVDDLSGSQALIKTKTSLDCILRINPAKIIASGGGAVHYSTVALDKYIFDDDTWEVVLGFRAVDILLQYFIANKISSFEFLPISSTRIVRSRGSWSAYSRKADNRVSYRVALANYIIDHNEIFANNPYYSLFLRKYLAENLKLIIVFPRHSGKLLPLSLKLMRKIF